MTVSLTKLNVHELRDIAVSLGADRARLYGTSRQAAHRHHHPTPPRLNAMTDVRRLNETIAALRPTRGARRSAGKVFTLTLQADIAILQGPRGNVVANFFGTHSEMRAAAEAHVARIPGATLNVY